MLEILQAPSHVAAFRLSDEVTGSDYDRLIAELESRLRMHPRIAVYADLTALHHLTGEAIGKDVRYGFSKRKQLHRFARAGVVSDKKWPRLLASLAQPFTPIELRSFHGTEREAALAWTTEAQPEVSATPALRLIATTRPDTYAFVWNGKVTRNDIERIVRLLKVELESHPSVRLLGRLERMGGFELSSLLTSGLLRVKLLGMRKVERYALVGGPAWLQHYLKVLCRLSGIDMRHFPLDREPEAWSWLEAQPAARTNKPLTQPREARGPLN